MTICGTRFGPYNSPSQPMLILHFAKLNPNQIEIPNVYLDRKTASTMNEYSIGLFDNAAKHGTIGEWHY
jgi:hypothetical protein